MTEAIPEGFDVEQEDIEGVQQIAWTDPRAKRFRTAVGKEQKRVGQLRRDKAGLKAENAAHAETIRRLEREQEELVKLTTRVLENHHRELEEARREAQQHSPERVPEGDSHSPAVTPVVEPNHSSADVPITEWSSVDEVEDQSHPGTVKSGRRVGDTLPDDPDGTPDTGDNE